MKLLYRFSKCESGATAIEYGLIAALIGIVIVTSLTNLGSTVKTTFTTVNTKLSTANAK